MQLYDRGVRDFGENRVQEMVDKYQRLPKSIRWHQIGQLQRNKVKYIAPFVHMIHSVDSVELLKTINSQAAKHQRNIQILLQLKIAEEDTKAGMSEKDALMILGDIDAGVYEHITLQGIMGMATFSDDEQQVRGEFAGLKIFQLSCIDAFPQLESHLQVLSMGMSGDYEVAIAEGSTMVRIGSKLFGARSKN